MGELRFFFWRDGIGLDGDLMGVDPEERESFREGKAAKAGRDGQANGGNVQWGERECVSRGSGRLLLLGASPFGFGLGLGGLGM